MAAYGTFLGYSHLWFEAGVQGISRPAQVIVFLSLGTAGLLTGQMVRASPATGPCRRPLAFLSRLPPTVADSGGTGSRSRSDSGHRRGGPLDNVAVGIGLVLLGVLLGLALFLPASNGDLEPDTLIGLSFG